VTIEAWGGGISLVAELAAKSYDTIFAGNVRWKLIMEMLQMFLVRYALPPPPREYVPLLLLRRFLSGQSCAHMGLDLHH
jgi:hypothetical protein